MTCVFELIARKKWDEIRRLLSLFKRCTRFGVEIKNMFNLSIFNGDRLNYFHFACASSDVPQDVIESMINISHYSLIKLSGSLSLPIHYACATGSYETLTIILNQLARKQQIGERVSSIKFQLSHLDLHEYSPIERVWLHHLMIPIDTNQKVNVDCDGIVIANLRKLTQISSTNDLKGNIKSLWKKTTLILFAFDSNMNPSNLCDGKDWNIIHKISKSGGANGCWCPSIVLWLALKMFPYQTKWKDERGDLPLHILLKNAPLKILWLTKRSLIRKVSTDIYSSAIRMLLQAYPRASFVKDSSGRLPLHLAIQNGIAWCDGIELLLEKHPDSISSIDPVTKLYPFMLAASLIDRKRDSYNESIDSIFRLLQANPSLVGIGIKESYQEIYLNQKVKKMREERNMIFQVLRKRGFDFKYMEEEINECKRRRPKLII